MTRTSEQSHAPERSRSRRRRRWTDEEKRRIVAECEAPGCSVSIVARRHDLNANQLFTWLRQLQRGQFEAGPEPAFVPAIIAPNNTTPLSSPTAALEEHQDNIKHDLERRHSGVIEIVLTGGRRVIVEERVSAAALARVIGVLEGR